MYPVIEYEVKGTTAEETDERAWNVALAYFKCPENQLEIEFLAGTMDDEVRTVPPTWVTTVIARRVRWTTNGRG